MTTNVTTNVPVLPIAGSTVLRATFALLALVAHWIKALARARRHRRDAHVLAGLDRHMLADIGLTSADVRDAFSSRFWEDPTELLAARAGERRCRHGHGAARLTIVAPTENGFHRLPVDRPARLIV
jgi:uncharacterized protein YjiS (DUF1127 family)